MENKRVLRMKYDSPGFSGMVPPSILWTFLLNILD
jgi:hypothetical protein